MDLDVVQNLDEYLDTLGKSCVPRGAFSGCGFLETWWAFCGKGKQFLGFVGYEGSEPVAFAPLYKKKRGITSAWRWAGDSWHNVMSAAIVPGYEAPFLRMVLEELARIDPSGVVVFADVNSETALYQVLASIGNCMPLYLCPYVEIGGDWEVRYREILPSKRRREVSRALQALSLVGRVEHRVVDGSDPDRLDAVLSECARLHSLRFSHTFNTSRFSEPRMLRAYKVLMSRLAAENGALISYLTVEEEMVSFILGFVEGKTFIDSVPAIDPAFTRYSIGHVHLSLLLPYLNSIGITRFDFSKGDATYKRKWCSGVATQYRFVCALSRRATWRERMVNYLHGVKDFGRRTGINSRLKRTLGAIRSLPIGRHEKVIRGVTLSDLPPLSWERFRGLRELRALPVIARELILSDLYLHGQWPDWISLGKGSMCIRLSSGEIVKVQL